MLERVDHRSFASRGIDREPTVHEGPDVRDMEARGISTDRGTLNRAIAERKRNRETRERTAGGDRGQRTER